MKVEELNPDNIEAIFEIYREVCYQGRGPTRFGLEPNTVLRDLTAATDRGIQA